MTANRWLFVALLAADGGAPAKTPHDFRRTAVRNLVRSGVPQPVAMKLTGHNADAASARYDIIDERDLEGAALLLDGRSAPLERSS